MSKSIRTIHSLNRTLRELKEKQTNIESKLDLNMQNLKSNYFGMTMNSVFGSKKKSTASFWANIVGQVMESEKLQNGISKLAGSLADKVGEGIHKAFGHEKWILRQEAIGNSEYRKGAWAQSWVIGNSEYKKGTKAQRDGGDNRQEAIVNTKKGQGHKGTERSTPNPELPTRALSVKRQAFNPQHPTSNPKRKAPSVERSTPNPYPFI